MNEQALLGLADDELVLGWRDSEWTGIAPMLEEDVAFSSIAQNEIGHARAVYELLVRADGDADALAFDRKPEEYRCAPLVELHLLEWAHTIARRWLYEVFRRERKGQPFEHAGSVEAPDADFAEAWAREQYGRRGESVALWLVPRDAIRDVQDWADEFGLKYRRVDGYSIKARLKEARERAGTAGTG